VQPRSRTACRRCGTGIAPDRDTTGSWRDVDEPCASLPACRLAGRAASAPSPWRTRRFCRHRSAHRRQTGSLSGAARRWAKRAATSVPKFARLFAGGRWIRTSGSAYDANAGLRRKSAASAACRRRSSAGAVGGDQLRRKVKSPNRALIARGTESSNPSPSSEESRKPSVPARIVLGPARRATSPMRIGAPTRFLKQDRNISKCPIEDCFTRSLRLRAPTGCTVAGNTKRQGAQP
jgi:hypothetical protein